MNKKEVFYLSIGVFLTVIAWLVADIYHSATEEKIKSKISIPKQESYTIDKEILETIESKKQ